MSTYMISRRGLVLSTFALVACQTTGADVNTDRVLTSAYDGRYEVSVLRTWEYTAWTAASGNWARWGGQLEELARLDIAVEGGVFSVQHIYDKSTGSNYRDFSGKVYSDGYMELRMTAGYEVGKQDTKVIGARGFVANALGLGRSVILDAGRFDDNHLARVRIRAL